MIKRGDVMTNVIVALVIALVLIIVIIGAYRMLHGNVEGSAFSFLDAFGKKIPE